MRLASFEAVIRALHEAEVRYLIGGGLAVGVHGYLRSTPDVDLVAQLVPENLGRLFAALQIPGYRPEVPMTAEQFADPAARRHWIAEQGMQSLAFRSDRHPETPIRVLAAEPFPFEEEYGRALVKPLHGAIAVRFVCIETLIRVKEASGRLTDLADADQLRLTLKVHDPVELQPGEFDWRLTTWEGSRREQLRYWATLPLERAVEVLEGLEELTERFRELRENGQFYTASSRSSPATEADAPLESAAGEAEDASYGMEAGYPSLARAAAGAAGALAPRAHCDEIEEIKYPSR